MAKKNKTRKTKFTIKGDIKTIYVLAKRENRLLKNEELKMYQQDSDSLLYWMLFDKNNVFKIFASDSWELDVKKHDET